MKKYTFAGLDTAMSILRPNATYELAGIEIIKWDDPRPKPTTEEILNMVEQIRKFEDTNQMEVISKTGEVTVVDIQEFTKDYFNKIST